MGLFSSGTRGLSRAYSCHDMTTGVKGISKYHALIQLCPKVGRETRIPLPYLFLGIKGDSLPQVLSNRFSAARTGSHVHLQMYPWKREGDYCDGLRKMLIE